MPPEALRSSVLLVLVAFVEAVLVDVVFVDAVFVQAVDAMDGVVFMEPVALAVLPVGLTAFPLPASPQPTLPSKPRPPQHTIPRRTPSLPHIPRNIVGSITQEGASCRRVSTRLAGKSDRECKLPV